MWDECCGRLELHDYEEACAADAGSQDGRLEVGSWNRDGAVGRIIQRIIQQKPTAHLCLCFCCYVNCRYGEAAFQQLMPLSFALPEELEEWRTWVKAHRRQEPGLWMLKTGQDAGGCGGWSRVYGAS